MSKLISELPVQTGPQQLDPCTPITHPGPSQSFDEDDLMLEGRDFRLYFTRVKRKSATRGFNRGHDDRDQFPATMWTGDLGIWNRDNHATAHCVFVTEIFWNGHIPGLSFKDVLFLMICNKKLHVLRYTESQYPLIVDVMAYEALKDCVYSAGSVKNAEGMDIPRIRIRPLPATDSKINREPLYDNFGPVPGVLRVPGYF